MENKKGRVQLVSVEELAKILDVPRSWGCIGMLTAWKVWNPSSWESI
jgi:hypothetical protein